MPSDVPVGVDLRTELLSSKIPTGRNFGVKEKEDVDGEEDIQEIKNIAKEEAENCDADELGTDYLTAELKILDELLGEYLEGDQVDAIVDGEESCCATSLIDIVGKGEDDDIAMLTSVMDEKFASGKIQTSLCFFSYCLTDMLQSCTQDFHSFEHEIRNGNPASKHLQICKNYIPIDRILCYKHKKSYKNYHLYQFFRIKQIIKKLLLLLL